MAATGAHPDTERETGGRMVANDHGQSDAEAARTPAPDMGGEAACLLHRVCEECGRLTPGREDRCCARCGGPLPS